MKKMIPYSLFFFFFFTLLCGIIYPLMVTGIAQVFWKERANGCIVEKEGQPIGSSYLGQEFTEDKYFWGRLIGKDLDEIEKDKKREERRQRLLQTSSNTEIPKDLLTFSASDLDPDISFEAAYYQVERIAKERKMPVETIEEMIQKHSKIEIWSKERYVNVLELNLAFEE